MKRLSLLFLVLIVTACARFGENNPYPVRPEDTLIKSHTSNEEVICSFNIQFMGNSKIRKNSLLAELLKRQNCSLVVIQEIVAPPDLRLLKNNSYEGKAELPLFPNSDKSWVPQPVVTEFFQSMQENGFDSFWLSEQDTGPGETNMTNGSATEWWAVFYKSKTWKPAFDLPHGFLEEDVTNNGKWDRVPYAFSMRHISDRVDFTLINVHLRPGGDKLSQARRQEELSAIKDWITIQAEKSTERDYIVVGDCNIENSNELSDLVSPSFAALNVDAVFMTNTNVRGYRPYDHVFFDPKYTSEISLVSNFEVVQLVDEMKKVWDLAWGVFPGEEYNHNLFRLYFSDHNPVKFKINTFQPDDD